MDDFGDFGLIGLVIVTKKQFDEVEASLVKVYTLGRWIEYDFHLFEQVDLHDLGFELSQRVLPDYVKFGIKSGHGLSSLDLTRLDLLLKNTDRVRDEVFLRGRMRKAASKWHHSLGHLVAHLTAREIGGRLRDRCHHASRVLFERRHFLPLTA